jgi:hypothetical protein
MSGNVDEMNNPKNRLDSSCLSRLSLPHPGSFLARQPYIIGTPKIMQIFAIFDPNMLPIAMPDAPSITANRETTASGSEVRNATIMKPMLAYPIPVD